MNVSNTLTQSTVANMLACELTRLGVAVAEDPDLRDRILNSSAELIIRDNEATKSIDAMVYSIQGYIQATRHNYPSYFTTGE